MQKFKKKRIKRYKNLNIKDKIVIIIIQYDGPHRKIQGYLQIIRSNKRLRESPALLDPGLLDQHIKIALL